MNVLCEKRRRESIDVEVVGNQQRRGFLCPSEIDEQLATMSSCGRSVVDGGEDVGVTGVLDGAHAHSVQSGDSSAYSYQYSIG